MAGFARSVAVVIKPRSELRETLSEGKVISSFHFAPLALFCRKWGGWAVHLGNVGLDHRLFFVVGDFLASIAIGAIVGLMSWALVGPSWNMWIAMFVMMALGMIAGLIFFFPVGIKLGAMEAMVPIMFSGEISGMVVGMICAMTVLSPANAVLLGAASGMTGIVFIWIANSVLRGVTREAEEI